MGANKVLFLKRVSSRASLTKLSSKSIINYLTKGEKVKYFAYIYIYIYIYILNLDLKS